MIPALPGDGTLGGPVCPLCGADPCCPYSAAAILGVLTALIVGAPPRRRCRHGFQIARHIHDAGGDLLESAHLAKLHGEAMDVESQYATSGLNVDGTRRAWP